MKIGGVVGHDDVCGIRIDAASSLMEAASLEAELAEVDLLTDTPVVIGTDFLNTLSCRTTLHFPLSFVSHRSH